MTSTVLARMQAYTSSQSSWFVELIVVATIPARAAAAI
jgi:hypothetical protein